MEAGAAATFGAGVAAGASAVAVDPDVVGSECWQAHRTRPNDIGIMKSLINPRLVSTHSARSSWIRTYQKCRYRPHNLSRIPCKDQREPVRAAGGARLVRALVGRLLARFVVSEEVFPIAFRRFENPFGDSVVRRILEASGFDAFAIE